MKQQRTLLPVMRPSFNAREICKEAVLLEHHLNEPHQRCRDCINKHFLTIEALAEEAISLHCPSKKRVCPKEMYGIPTMIRELQSNLAARRYSDLACAQTAAHIRKLRKRLMCKHAVIPLNQMPQKRKSPSKSRKK